jgi:hypothetical protein
MVLLRMLLAAKIDGPPEGTFRRAWRLAGPEPILPPMAANELIPVSLDPCPVIEAYKKDVDRTLLRENLSSPSNSAS